MASAAPAAVASAPALLLASLPSVAGDPDGDDDDGDDDQEGDEHHPHVPAVSERCAESGRSGDDDYEPQRGQDPLPPRHGVAHERPTAAGGDCMRLASTSPAVADVA